MTILSEREFGTRGRPAQPLNSTDLTLHIFLIRKISMEKAFRALASTPRRRILNHLAGGPMTVGEIAEKFDMAMPSISKHLSVLHDAGLVHQQKRGQHIIYSIAADNLANNLYAFLTPFCPEARKLAAERKLVRRDQQEDRE
jgi:DNA-binding transcriptional ArsR family regulator